MAARAGARATGATAGTRRSAVEELIREKYRGIRPAPGYPACPDHTEKRLLFDLLDVEERAGIRLTETFAMLPAASVVRLLLRAPGGALLRASARSAATRWSTTTGARAWTSRAVERWLAPNLGYEPGNA